jgi:hypothetical protein
MNAKENRSSGQKLALFGLFLIISGLFIGPSADALGGFGLFLFVAGILASFVQGRQEKL